MSYPQSDLNRECELKREELHMKLKLTCMNKIVSHFSFLIFLVLLGSFDCCVYFTEENVYRLVFLDS